MALTLHCNASDNDKLFKTYVGTGVHTGTPADGEVIEVWDDEGDGVADVALMWTGTSKPAYRSSAPLMALSCLDFDGTDDKLTAYEQDGGGGAGWAVSTFIDASAFHVLVAFYAESVTSTAANVYENHCLIGETGGFWGLYLKDVSGTKTLFGYVYDGAVKTVSVACPVGASHVAMMRLSGGTLYLSIDGGAESSTACGSVSDMTFPLTVGRGYDPGSQYFNGRIGEFSIYDSDPGGAGDHLDYFIDKWLGAGTGTGTGTGAGGGITHYPLGGLLRHPLNRLIDTRP